MKVLVISDTHKRLANLEKVLAEEGPFDAVLHCGDVEGDEERVELMAGCPVYMVAGNCDYNGANPFDRVVTLEGHKIFMSHGHRYSVGFSTDYLARMAKSNMAELAFYGHLHIPNIENNDGIIVASPGSLSEPRQAGRKPSYIIMQLEAGKTPELEYRYLEK